MRALVVMVLAFAFVVWDIRQNNGHYTFAIQTSVDRFAHEVGLL
jgi:hypothetical protein